ncbi:hypothetical protein MKX01_033694 [Papaver californicum]|nr:hypothetical protein MKX01_033694 [Papaver californicum]
MDGHLRSRTILVIFSIVVSGLCSSSKVSCDPNTNTTSILCNSGVYTKGDPFATSLAYVLSDLEATTTSTFLLFLMHSPMAMLLLPVILHLPVPTAPHVFV